MRRLRMMVVALMLVTAAQVLAPGHSFPGARSAVAQGAVAEVELDPATRRAYRHVFLAFGIAWVLMLGYVVMLDRRFRAVERELGRGGGG